MLCGQQWAGKRCRGCEGASKRMTKGESKATAAPGLNQQPAHTKIMSDFSAGLISV